MRGRLEPFHLREGCAVGYDVRTLGMKSDNKRWLYALNHICDALKLMAAGIDQ